MDTNEIVAPAGYVPQQAIAFGAEGTEATPVDPAHPLPVRQTEIASSATPLTGTSAASAVVGPFAPELGRPVWLTLSGSWSGSVGVLRSIDSGATKLPLTIAGQRWGLFTANAQEPIGVEDEAGARWYLDIALTAGTLSYRVAQ